MWGFCYCHVKPWPTNPAASCPYRQAPQPCPTRGKRGSPGGRAKCYGVRTPCLRHRSTVSALQMAQVMLAPPKHGFGTPNATEARLRHSKWRKACLRHRSMASALQMAQGMLASPEAWLRHSKWRKPCLRHRSMASALQMAQAMLASPKHGFGTRNGARHACVTRSMASALQMPPKHGFGTPNGASHACVTEAWLRHSKWPRRSEEALPVVQCFQPGG